MFYGELKKLYYQNLIQKSIKAVLPIGPPGCGKGTFSQLLSQKYNLLHISQGDFLRRQILSEQNQINIQQIRNVKQQQRLIQSQINDLTLDQVQKNCNRVDGFIFDFGTRYFSDLDELFIQYNFDKLIVIELQQDFKIIKQKLLKRTHCDKCGLIYNSFKLKNKNFNFEPIEGKDKDHCNCGGRLQKRYDDTKDQIEKRLKVYQNQIVEHKNILKAYDNLDYFELNISQGVQDFSKLEDILNQYFVPLKNQQLIYN